MSINDIILSKLNQCLNYARSLIYLDVHPINWPNYLANIKLKARYSSVFILIWTTVNLSYEMKQRNFVSINLFILNNNLMYKIKYFNRLIIIGNTIIEILAYL